MDETKHLDDDLLNRQMHHIIEIVGLHLMKRTQHYGLKHDEDGKFSIGGTYFWLIRHPKHGVRLGFNTNPKKWDYDAIRLDIVQDEHGMYKDIGLFT